MTVEADGSKRGATESEGEKAGGGGGVEEGGRAEDTARERWPGSDGSTGGSGVASQDPTGGTEGVE